MSNLQVWKQRAVKCAAVKIVPELNKNGDNVKLFFCADVIGSKRFVQNYGGYPRNEIAQINEAASLEMQYKLLETLTDYSPSDNPNVGKTDAEIMLSHRSKYLQTPSEMVSWLDSQLERRNAEREAVQIKSESSVQFNDSDAKTTDNV